MTKHTPGPWTSVDNGNAEYHSWVVLDDLNHIIARCPKEHNARLIAAAPYMLNALKALLARRNGVWDDPALLTFGPLTHNVDVDCNYIILAGIKKATGE